LWDAETCVEIRRFHGHTERVYCVAFLPDGRRIVSCGGIDRTVRLWDMETGHEIHCFRGHRVLTNWVAVSPDGRWLLSADHEGQELRLWDVEARKQVDQVSYGVKPIHGCFTPDGRQALWAGQDRAVRLYRLQPVGSGRGETQ
jgi:WD40 repeat protein